MTVFNSRCANRVYSLSPVPPVRILERSQIDFEAREQQIDYDSDDEHIGSIPQHQYYKSGKLLGKLYRAIDEKQIWKNDIHRHEVRPGAESIWLKLLRLMTANCQKYGISWEHKSDEAKRIKDT
jgi:hypothetical protein